MVPIALDPDFESLAETLTSLSLDLEDSDSLNSLLREAAQAASLAKEQAIAQRRQSHSEHRSLQEILTTASQQLPTITTPYDGSASTSSNPMDISPVSPAPRQPSKLSYAQAANKRIRTLASSPSKQEQIKHLPTCLQKRRRELDYTSTFRFVKLWFRDGHWSDNLEPTFRKDAPPMPDIPRLIASLRRRKSDVTMISSLSRSSRSSSTQSESDSDTETESSWTQRGPSLRRRDRSRDEVDQSPQYLTPNKGKQPKSYRSSLNLYELPAGVAPEKAKIAYTPSNLSSSRLRGLESEKDEGQIEPLNRAVGAEGKDEVDEEVFMVPKLRKRPGMGGRGDRSRMGSASPGGGSEGGGVQRSGGNSGTAGGGRGMPFWMPMGHTNGPTNGSSGAMEGVDNGR